MPIRLVPVAIMKRGWCWNAFLLVMADLFACNPFRLNILDAKPFAIKILQRGYQGKSSIMKILREIGGGGR